MLRALKPNTAFILGLSWDMLMWNQLEEIIAKRTKKRANTKIGIDSLCSVKRLGLIQLVEYHLYVLQGPSAPAEQKDDCCTH